MTVRNPAGDEASPAGIPARWWLRLGHDLRAPIGPMRMAMQFLRGNQGSPEERQDALSLLDRQMDQLLANIDDLSDLARINAGVFAVKPASGDLNLVVDLVDGRKGLARQLEERQLSLRCICTDSAVMADHDPGRLAGLLEFLIAKLARHVVGGSSLSLEAGRSHESERAELRIRGAGNSFSVDPECAFVAGLSAIPIEDLEARAIVLREVVRLHDIEFSTTPSADCLVLSMPGN